MRERREEIWLESVLEGVSEGKAARGDGAATAGVAVYCDNYVM